MTPVWAAHSFTINDVVSKGSQPYYEDDRNNGEDNRRYSKVFSIGGERSIRNYEMIPFSQDSSISPIYKALPIDYDRNDYIRGLLIGRDFVPNTRQFQQSILTMSNTVPMTARFKKRVWEKVDQLAINILKDAPDSRIHMVSGVLYDPNLTTFKNGVVVNSVNRKVAVPDAYFRLFYVEDKKRMYAVMIPRKDAGRALYKYTLPVDEVERLSGYNFFSWVDDSTEINQERKTGNLKFHTPKTNNGEQVDLGKAFLSIFK